MAKAAACSGWRRCITTLSWPLERNAGRRALLDYHADAGFGWAFNAEVTLRKMTVFGTLNQPETLILGLGISGLSMARWCARHGCRLRIADTRATPPKLPQLRAEGLDTELNCSRSAPACRRALPKLRCCWPRRARAASPFGASWNFLRRRCAQRKSPLMVNPK